MPDKYGLGGKDPKIKSDNGLPSHTVIIHGTWANNESWWRWPSEFPQYIDLQACDVYKKEHPYTWSGDNTDEARREGGKILLDWVHEHPVQKLIIIAHSHGGNVAFIASQIGLKIHKLILMGTPIRTDYLPNMENIQKVYNIYSNADYAQILGALPYKRNSGRHLPEASENISVETKTSNPHSELHTIPLWQNEGLVRILTEGSIND